ncbi:hypothetical protein [Streptococcus merionis]
MTILALLIYLLVLTWLIVFKLATAPYLPKIKIGMVVFILKKSWLMF